ncbi:MAG: hypothetical protein K2N51_09955 [Lachnospiraceae bacterium]|nr:hypothetical protein [Lachnospiraceae bacterium]
MYITKYLDSGYIFGTDDSLTFLEYLKEKQKEEISLEEIFSDIGLDKLNGDFRQHEEPLTVVLANVESDYDEPYMEFYYAIDLIMNIAALLLECKVSGSVDLCELCEEEDLENGMIRITATPEEHQLINKALKDFSAAPLDYDLSEMVDEEEMKEMAGIGEKLRKELYE